MGCFGGSTTTTNNVTKTEVPQWVEDAGKSVVAAGQNLFNSPYQAYTGNRVADLTSGQQSAINTAAGTTPQRVVDEGGFLGKISDYLNPYTSAVLDPAIEQLNKSYASNRKSLAGAATSANAFGDARQGILEAEMNSNQAKDIAATTANIMNTGYTQAMGERQADQTGFYNQLAQLLNIGGVQQQNEQNKLDTDYEAYQAAQQSPYDKLAALKGNFGG